MFKKLRLDKTKKNMLITAAHNKSESKIDSKKEERILNINLTKKTKQ